MYKLKSLADDGTCFCTKGRTVFPRTILRHFDCVHMVGILRFGGREKWILVRCACWSMPARELGSITGVLCST